MRCCIFIVTVVIFFTSSNAASDLAVAPIFSRTIVVQEREIPEKSPEPVPIPEKDCGCHNKLPILRPACGCPNVLNTCVENPCKCHGVINPYSSLSDAIKSILHGPVQQQISECLDVQEVWKHNKNKLAELWSAVLTCPHYGSLIAFLNQCGISGKIGDEVHHLWPSLYKDTNPSLIWSKENCFEKNWFDYHAPSYTCNIVDSDCKDYNIARAIRLFIRNLFNRPVQRLESRCLQKIAILQKKWKKLISETEEIDKECNFLNCVSGLSWKIVSEQISAFIISSPATCAPCQHSEICDKLKHSISAIIEARRKELIEWYYCRFLPTHHAQYFINILGSCLFKDIIRSLGKSKKWEQWLVHGYQNGICWDELWTIILHSECWTESRIVIDHEETPTTTPTPPPDTTTVRPGGCTRSVIFEYAHGI